MAFYLSEDESSFLNLKVIRNQNILPSLDIQDLRTAFQNHEGDVARLKVDMTDTAIFQKLESLKDFKYEIYTINARLLAFADSSFGALQSIPDNLRAVKVDQANYDSFVKCVDEIIRSRGCHVYESKAFRTLVPKEVEIDMSVNYLSSFGTKNFNSRFAWLLMDKTDVIGAFMGEKAESGFIGTLYGTLNSFRGLGYAKYIFHFMKEECIANCWRTFEIDVSMSNGPSLSASISSEMKIRQTFFHITVLPCRSAQKSSDIVVS